MKALYVFALVSILFSVPGSAEACQTHSLKMPEELTHALNAPDAHLRDLSTEMALLNEEFMRDQNYYKFLIRDYCTLITEEDGMQHYRYLPEIKDTDDEIDAQLVKLLIKKWNG